MSLTRNLSNPLRPLHRTPSLSKMIEKAAQLPFKVNTQVSQAINEEMPYWALVIGHGRNRADRIFYRNLIFSQPELAEFFYRQEMFSMPAQNVIATCTVAPVGEHELQSRKDLVVFDMPSAMQLMFSDFIMQSAMTIPMALHGDYEEPETLYYSGRFALFSHNEYIDALDEESYETAAQATAMLIGIRLRPAIFSPDRYHYLSFREDGLPGLWAPTLGIRNEVAEMSQFAESFEDAYYTMRQEALRCRR